jgi:uncharacterized protein YegL
MRRLPVYFLIDVSESMIGEPLEQVQEGIASIVKELRSDPYALETVWISVIVFAGRAKTLIPLTDIIQFYPTKLPVGSGTNFGSGLTALMSEIDSSVVKTTSDKKGDWKPIVFLFTDGRPTDNPRSAIDIWKKNYSSQTFFISISLGSATDTSLLSEISEYNLTFNGGSTSDYKKFFKWVTASIKATSTRIAETQSQSIDLTKNADSLVTKSNDGTERMIDENVATFLAKCQNTKFPYLIKYIRSTRPVEISGLNLESIYYRLNGAFVLEEESYLSLSEKNLGAKSISTEELLGFPACPCCGNQFGFAFCSCGNLLCVGDEEYTTCPWCNSRSQFGAGDGHLNINRTRG